MIHDKINNLTNSFRTNKEALYRMENDMNEIFDFVKNYAKSELNIMMNEKNECDASIQKVVKAYKDLNELSEEANLDLFYKGNMNDKSEVAGFATDVVKELFSKNISDTKKRAGK